MRDDSEALRWLFSLADQERGVGWNPRASPDEQWKLGHTRALLDIAGAPDGRLRIALVAGTKGKGSTCAMLASILGAAGVRCGLYTKPHLQTYRERIRIDGLAITRGAFDVAVGRMRSHVNTLLQQRPAAGEPTSFEVTTAIAVDEFARRGCDVGVIEVGLGGRLDATNALEPLVSVITSISYDHTAILGGTLGAIAHEKAGILRRGRPAILARQRPAAMRALRCACDAVGALCQEVGPGAPVWDLPLAGAHQQQNAALAVAAARLMAASVDDQAIERGLARLRWAGRFEVIDANPPVILDGAHNGASAEALAATLLGYAAGRPISVVVGINRDKDARAVLRPLLAIAHSVWATQAQDNPRALDASDLARLSGALGRGGRTTARVSVHVKADLGQALDAARAAAASAGGVVCVTGSLMVVGQARERLGLAVPEQLW
ncbi:MAG: bifunctional folylpolyglutamate synthase/dihydrofolate synthase [Chloroflexota bacterium]|nr:bifunctional folylpolyglutamate synthase/dihydrofolate synthase [Chloroflexota bacterium]